jgi:hypothetical protein
LKKLSDRLQSDALPKMSVSFLRDDMRVDEGVDAGGLSRDYMDELFAGIIQSKKNLFKHANSSLALPHSDMRYENGQFPKLGSRDCSLFNSIGQIIMYCYRSLGRPSLGRHFDDALFKAVLCLTAKEIDQPYNNLKLETKLKIGKALLEVHQDSGDNMQHHLKRFDWLGRYQTLNQLEIKEAAEALFIGRDACPISGLKTNNPIQPQLSKIEKSLNNV